MNIKKLFFSLLLLVVGASANLFAQSAVTAGSQVTSENSIVSGKAYLVYYVGNGSSGYMKDTGSAYTGKDDSNPNERAVYYFTTGSTSGTWKVQNYYTGKYWGTPTANANTYIGSDTGGDWALNFQSGNNIAPSCNGHSWNRSGSNIHPWSTGTANVNQFQIYEVALSTTALSDFMDKDITMSSTAATSLTTGTWYVMSQRSRTSYVYEDVSSHTLKHTLTAPIGSDKANYCVRLVSGTDGNYYLQTGLGNYVGQITASTNVPTTALKQEQLIINKIASTDGHFYVQSSTGNVVLDANDFTGGDPSTVVGWGTTAPTSTGGNNDWAFYPIELVDSWEPTIDEVYTINNTNSGRGAMMYNGSSSYVWSSGKSGTFSASEPNCQWVLVPTGTTNQYYLYNVGAGKFAIPSGTASTASWIFSSNAVAVTFIPQSNGTKKIKTVTTDTYAAVSNGYNGPIINYNDAGGNFTITKVDGDASTAATTAFNKLVDKKTAASAVPASGSDGWYIIRIKTHGTYADKYVYPAESEINYNGTYYPLTFDHGANIRPAIDDAAYYTRIINESNKVYWQMPNGKYLYGSNNKFPVSTATKSTFSMDYTSGSGFRLWGGSLYAVPYYLGSQYFIGETASSGNAYYDIYPIDLAAAGLTAWQVSVEGLDASTKVTCTRPDVSGLTSVYSNGFFFLPTGSTPAYGEFTAEVSGSTLTLPVTIDTEAHTITTAMPVLTINSPMAEATFTWNGESQTGKSVTFVYTGGAISDTNITVTYSGNEYTSPTLSQTTWDGTASANVTCTLNPAFFSDSYGQKWIRISNAQGGNTVMGLTTATSGETVKMKTLDYFDDAQLWCFVGDATSFNIYNKKAGESLQMASSSTTITNDVTAVMAVAGATATTWKLQDKWDASNGPGWAIFYSGHDGSKSLNAKGGTAAGNNVGYWSNGDSNGGSRWLINDASGEVTLDLAGLDPTSMTVYTQNIAVLPSTIAGSSSETLLTKDNFATRTAYVPNNTELTFGTPKMFMNYGFTGYDGSNQKKTVTATTTPQTVTATFSVVRPDARYLWEPLRIYNGSGEKDYYRIPAIVTAKNGDVIAINDRRWNNDTDLGNNSGTAANPVNHHIDIIGVASSDNGQTWGSEFMIMDGTGSGLLAGYGDAAVVADRESNKVLVMACAGNVFYTGQNNSYHQTLQRTVLTHNGTTWVAETPTDVTNQFFSGSLASSDGMFIGSGAISQSKIIKKGDYYRIYCAVLERSTSNFVFYSDDFGLTWMMMGSTAPANDNEPKVEELPDGSVLLSVRKSYGRTFNVWTWDDDTYTTGSWGTAVASNNQTGGISFGNNSTNGDIRMIPAIKKATGEVVTLAMQSVPTAGSRAEVSLFYKELDPAVTYTPTTIAQNWSSRFLVTPHSSAYSSFILQPDGRIAFFMEEAPKSVTGYYMCYVPLSIDEITGGTYEAIPTVYTRTITPENFGTFCLPYDASSYEGAKFYKIAGKKMQDDVLSYITLEEVTALEGGVGYLFQAEGSELNIHYHATAMYHDIVETSTTGLIGSYESKYIPQGMYVLKNNKVYYVDQENYAKVGINKAYIDLSNVSDVDESQVKLIRLMNGDFVTGIDGMSREMQDNTIFNLAGQRVSRTTKGVYIVKGKKVAVK